MGNILNIEEIVNEFEKRRPIYEKFGNKLSIFLKQKLKEADVEDVIIKDRAKKVKSFRDKITRPDKHYNDPINQITDLTGVRVIVFYTDQLQIVEDILNSEFYVDPDLSVDKSKTLKPNTFGYLSVHYIINLKSNKENLEEWKEFKGLKAEIQIRTSLQDAWATVSHALQYKKEADVPDNLKRKLFRLAGLFELADEQFESIKKESLQRIEEVKKQIEEGKTSEIKIDFLSITQFLSTSTMMREAINFANKYRILGNQEILEHYNKADCSLVTEECLRLKIDNIQILDEILHKTEIENEEFFKRISQGRTWKASHSFILFLLIIKAFIDKFDANYLVNKYGWDYLSAKKIIDNTIEVRKQFNR